MEIPIQSRFGSPLFIDVRSHFRPPLHFHCGAAHCVRIVSGPLNGYVPIMRRSDYIYSQSSSSLALYYGFGRTIAGAASRMIVIHSNENEKR